MWLEIQCRGGKESQIAGAYYPASLAHLKASGQWETLLKGEEST